MDFDLTGNAHVKMLERLFEIEPELLELANRNIPAPKVSASKREKSMVEQDYLCTYCETTLLTDEVTCLDHNHYDGSSKNSLD